jgi:hypothetical protein
VAAGHCWHDAVMTSVNGTPAIKRFASPRTVDMYSHWRARQANRYDIVIA